MNKFSLENAEQRLDILEGQVTTFNSALQNLIDAVRCQQDMVSNLTEIQKDLIKGMQILNNTVKMKKNS